MVDTVVVVVGRSAAVVLVAIRLPPWPNTKPLPWNVLLPDLVIASITPPVAPPISALVPSVLMFT